MSDYEIIGRATTFIVLIVLGLFALIAISQISWFLTKEVIGWARIVKALKMLRESEEGEK